MQMKIRKMQCVDQNSFQSNDNDYVWKQNSISQKIPKKKKKALKRKGRIR